MHSAQSENMYAVTLLFGPSIPGREQFLFEDPHLLGAETILPDDIFQQNPNLGLRDIALKVIHMLKQGKHVVISGGFRNKSSRTSLFRTIKKKVPACSFMCVKMLPKYGLKQILWSYQYALVTDSDKSRPSESHLKSWFDSNAIDLDSQEVDVPTEEEGYDVKEIMIPLTARSFFKLDFPGLMLQWEAVKDEKDNAHQQIINMCKKWSIQNPCGRIIIICDGREISQGLSSAHDELDHVQRCAKQVTNEVDFPIYVLRLISSLKSGSFSVPPQPGLLAFLQLRHLLNFQDNSTTYVFSSKDHMKMAEAVGVRHVQVTSVLKSPDAVLKGFVQMSPVPEMLKDLQVEKEKGFEQTKIPSLGLPLYEQLSQNITNGHALYKHQNGMEEHVFVKNWNLFLKCQELFVAQATPVDQPGSNLVKSPQKSLSNTLSTVRKRMAHDEITQVIQSSDKIPSWMIKKPRRESTIESVPSLKKEGSSARCLKTVYIMSEKELKEKAKRVLTEAGRDINEYQDEEPG